MKEISIFDVIGPNMIGPSSSHTAGALRIALLAGKLVSGRILRADFTLYGSFAKTYQGHGTDRALLGGILGYNTEDSRIRDSFIHADEAGLLYTFTPNDIEKEVHPNTVDIALTNEHGVCTTMRGVSTGGGNCRIEQINGVPVSISGNYNTIIIRQTDKPGIVAYIASCLGKHEINIAYMRLHREGKGSDAYTVLEVDSPVPADVLEEIERYPEIESAMLIAL